VTLCSYLARRNRPDCFAEFGSSRERTPVSRASHVGRGGGAGVVAVSALDARERVRQIWSVRQTAR